MKIAIPTTQSKTVDSHFGHCEFYTIYIIEDNKIQQTEILQSPQGCGCKSNIAATLNEMGITLMLAGGIGGGAINVLNQHGIDVVRGCQGNVDELVDSFIKGELIDSGETCSHHAHSENCNHN